LSTAYRRPDGKRLHFAVPRRRLRPRCNSADQTGVAALGARLTRGLHSATHWSTVAWSRSVARRTGHRIVQPSRWRSSAHTWAGWWLMPVSSWISSAMRSRVHSSSTNPFVVARAQPLFVCTSATVSYDTRSAACHRHQSSHHSVRVKAGWVCACGRGGHGRRRTCAGARRLTLSVPSSCMVRVISLVRMSTARWTPRSPPAISP
jgi:hypothetical protein